MNLDKPVSVTFKRHRGTRRGYDKAPWSVSCLLLTHQCLLRMFKLVSSIIKARTQTIN
jgi:hypothetical protein